MFFDETKVFLKAGNGGDGCMSFLRQKYMPKGGPNGGNGGKGGDLILQADENVADLRNYHFKKHWKAKKGEPGRGSDQNGRGGDPCILKVPMGTEVREMDSGELICELLKIDTEITLSFSFNFIPFIPFDDLPFNNLNFFDLNRIHFPN